MASKPKSSPPLPRAPHCPRGPVCRVPLSSVGDVRAEMGRVYREARSRRMPWHDATRACHVLATLARLIEGSEFEARIAALEQALEVAEADRQRRRPNGHSHPSP